MTQKHEIEDDVGHSGPKHVVLVNGQWSVCEVTTSKQPTAILIGSIYFHNSNCKP